MKFLWFLTAMLATAVMLNAQVPIELKHTILSPSTGRQSYTLEGACVATDGDFIITGMPMANGPTYSEGQVHVYSAATGTLLHKLRHPSPSDNGMFGSTLAMSGTRVVVVSPKEAKAYVFDLGSATPTQPALVLTHPSLGSFDLASRSVAIEGDTVVIGVPITGSSEALSSGCAYVYNLSGADPSTPTLTIENPTPFNQENFGKAVSISGSRIAVGAPGAYHGGIWMGAVYVFDIGTATPTTPLAELKNPNTTQQTSFGASVGISGSRLVVGAYKENLGEDNAGGAFLYDLQSAERTTPVATLKSSQPGPNNWYGYSVAISGTRVVVGAIFTRAVGIYDFTAPNPSTPIVELANPDLTTIGFGRSVATSGTQVVVGAERHAVGGVKDIGGAYVYDVGAATPATPVHVLSSPHPSPGDYFGFATALSGEYMVAGALNDYSDGRLSGGAYVYKLNSADPSKPFVALENPSSDQTGRFGGSVSISGTLAVVGAVGDGSEASNSGAAYIYDVEGADPEKPLLTLQNPSPNQGDEFGRAVAIAGSLVVVGAYGDDGDIADAGAAYVYDVSTATPSVPVAVLRHPAPSVGNGFGRSVAIHGTRVVVGAFRDDTGARDAGSVYVFDVSSPTPTVPIAVLNNPEPEESDVFGWSVAVYGGFVAVGAISDDGVFRDSGAAYVYDIDSPEPTTPLLVLANPSFVTGGEGFGSAVAIHEGRLVVGAEGAWAAGERPGAAYLYHLSGATTAPVAVISNPRPSHIDYFGAALAFDGRKIVVGSYLEDSPTVDKGAVYVFDSADTFTQAPLLLSPADHSLGRAPITIAFTLFEKALPGSVKLKLKTNSNEWVLSLSGAMESAGTHAITLDLANPASTPGVVSASGGAIPDGSYTVSVSYSDTAGNPVAQSSGSYITIDNTAPTLGPVRLTSVHNSNPRWAREGDTILLEVNSSESIKDPVILIGGQSVEAERVAGSRQIWKATLDVTAQVPAEGDVSVSISFEDFAGNVGTTVTTPAIDRFVKVDRTPPVLVLPPVTALAPDLSGVAVTFPINVSDNLDPSPQAFAFLPSGTVFPLGTSKVTVDGYDAAGNQATGQFDVTVWLEDPLKSVLLSGETPVPGAGEPNSRIPAGAIWKSFGVPSLVGTVGDQAAVGFLAKVSSPTGMLGVIFSGASTAPVARVTTGESVPNSIGEIVDGVKFKAFRDPVFSGAEYFAFVASVAGSGVTKANDQGIWAGSPDGLREVAREGAVAPGLGSIRLGAFTSLLMNAPGSLYFTATLKGPGVNAKNDLSFWFWDAESGLTLVQREGTVSPDPAIAELVKSFVTLAPVVGSAGHGRYDTQFVGGLLKLAGGTQVLVNFDGTEVASNEPRTGVELSPGVTIRSFGIPSFLPGGGAYTVRGELESAGNSKKTTAALIRDGLVIAAKGGAAPLQGEDNLKFTAFSDPVTNFGDNGSRMDLFRARVGGSKVKADNDWGLWSYAGEIPQLNLVAREGDQAPECAGSKFKDFTSFSVMTDRGPLFAATLRGGAPLIKRGPDAGLWGTDHAGVLRLLLRNGQKIGERMVKSFDVLGMIGGSPAQQRAWSEVVPATVITRCFFTDGSQGIVELIIP